MDYVRIFDTTLRDGEQSPGATMTSSEKLLVAKRLAAAGVDVIEAGFAAASPDDLFAIQQIAEKVGNAERDGGKEPPIICSLARAVKGDLDKAWEAVKGATRPRIHTFIATSPIHREHKLKMSKEEVLAAIDKQVAYAASLCSDIEFSPEDGGRTEPEFLCEALEHAIAAGATTLNIPDTVGYCYPEEYGQLIRTIKENVKGIDDVIISLHCHNDLGLAVANSLAGIKAGARQVEVAVNGIGERAGNTALEEVVMALNTRKDLYGLETGIDTTKLTGLSELISRVTGMLVQPNKAVVGKNAFAHEAGIHQDGMLKEQSTYEIMRPETVGARASQLVLGKHSGRHALAVRLEALGYDLKGESLNKAFKKFKDLTDRKKTITDADLQTLFTDELSRQDDRYRLKDLQVTAGTKDRSTAQVTLLAREEGEEELQELLQAAIGSGPVDAVFNAIDSMLDVKAELVSYQLKAVTRYRDALGEATVQVRSSVEGAADTIFRGHGADQDIIVASARAYLEAVNRLIVARGSEPVLKAQPRRVGGRVP